jgi:hypothetical protein
MKFINLIRLKWTSSTPLQYIRATEIFAYSNRDHDSSHAINGRKPVDKMALKAGTPITAAQRRTL